MDVYLMTSAFEGLPLALLEAMALGKPVVATGVGGIPEVLEDGASGYIAAVGAIDELAERVIRLLNDAALRADMGAAGAATVESRYHVRHRVEAIERLYRQVLEEAA
jgi:glycosyltransferase involved in cell wall biosynthesis